MKNILDGIKNIVFDFGCVIVDLDRRKCIEALNRIGAGRISHYVDECKQIDMFLDLELGKIDVPQFCQEVRRRAPECKASDEEISEAWGSLLTGIPVERLRAIERLHRKYNVYLLSNSNPVHWGKSVDRFFPASGHGPEYYFDKMFISYKMGMIKPDPRIFETLLKKTGSVPEETLFIDDSAANCKAAEEFGIRTLHVENGDDWLIGREAATIGFFDGVHRGHRFLIEQVKEVARHYGVASSVVTFAEHPRRVLHSDYQPQALTTADEKREMLLAQGIDECHVLDFDERMASLSARDFMKTVLKERFGVRFLIIGYDNRFGHNRSEGFDDYVRYGKELGIEVIRARAFELDGIGVSSSVVRALLSEGEVELAARCLGYRYSLSGKVVDGVKEGRRMGFPTANIDMDGMQKMIPANGVYAVEAEVDGGSVYPAMMNIGNRPTFDGQKTTMEVNIIDYQGNLYGRNLRVSFVKRIRAERKFPSEKALAAQLEKDRQITLDLLKKEK